MASILKVNTIQDATNSNTAMTVSTGGVTSFPNNPCFNVSKNADQTVPDATATKITFENITDGGNSGRNINKGGLYASSRFTVTATTTGIYHFWTNLLFIGGGDVDDMYIQWRKNNVVQSLNYHNTGYADNSSNGVINALAMMNLDTAGDYMELWLYANLGSGTTVLNHGDSTTNSRCVMGGFKIA